VPITTKVVSSTPAHGGVYYIQLYAIKGVSDLQMVYSGQRRIQDFKSGGAHFKKLRRAEGGAKIFGVFRVKNHHFTQKNHIFKIHPYSSSGRFFSHNIIFVL
jgi:hypothetical protein